MKRAHYDASDQSWCYQFTWNVYLPILIVSVYIPLMVESRGFRCKVSVYLSSLRWYSLCRSSPWCKENGLGPPATGHRVSSNPASLLRLIFQHSLLPEAKKEIRMSVYSELDFFFNNKYSSVYHIFRIIRIYTQFIAIDDIIIGNELVSL